MANFYLSALDSSDLTAGADFNKRLRGIVEAAGSISVPVANASTETSYAYTELFIPSNADWETGTIVVKVNVTTAVDIDLKLNVSRINSAGTVQESGTQTALQSLNSTGVKTFTIASKNWTAGACSDRIRIEYEFTSNNTHGGALTVVIESGTADSIVTLTDLTRNTGTCYGAFVAEHAQFRDDHATGIAEGGQSEGDGVSNNVYLDARVRGYDSDDTLTYKIENEAIGTAFDDVVNATASKGVQLDPSSPAIRRSAAVAYDSLRKRLILVGGYDGTTQYNDVWELSLDQLFSPQPQWRELSPTGTPMSARRTHVMEYDVTNDRMIVGFGYDGADAGDIFEIDFASSLEGAWGTLSPSGTAPEARAQPSSAFKASGDKFYLICGWGAARYNDVHELDCTTQGSEAWTELNDGTGTAPEARNDPASVFDSANNRLILFGGYTGTVYENDVWELDLTTNNYTEISPSGTIPAGREFAYHCYDSVNGRMVIWGGDVGTAAADVQEDLQELDLTDGSEAWTDRTLATGSMPAGSTSNTAIYDPEHELMLCFGGRDSSASTTGDENKHVIAFDLSGGGAIGVHQLYMNNGMKGRDAMGYAYNPDRRETLMVGGYARINPDTDIGDGEHTTEMWIYDHVDSEWYNPLRNAILGIPNREGATVVYDTNRNRFIIFGGLTGNETSNNTHYNDVWALEYSTAVNGYVLTKLNPTGTPPSARWLHAGVYDITNDRMIVFGGDADTTYLNDLHELDFSTSADGVWATLSPTGTPPSARRQPTYIYDATNGRMIISHGATSTTTFVGDTFELDLSTNNGAWTTLSPTGTAPSNRRGMTGVYMADKEYMFCIGGYNGSVVYNNSDYLDLTSGSEAWVNLTPTTSPETRRSHIAGYDQTSEVVVIYGGRDTPDNGTAFETRNNTYEFDTVDASEANWDWAEIAMYPWLNGSVPKTGLTATTNYHWQAWVTGSLQGDSEKQSAFANAESATDFKTDAGGAPTPVSITKSLQYTVVDPNAITKSLKYTVIVTPTAITKSLQYVVTAVDTFAIQKSLKYAVVTTSSLTDTYYFDGSDVAATDPDNVWIDETNTDDGSTSTFGSCSQIGSTSSKYVLIEGTNAPASGETITQVRARIYGRVEFGSASDDTNFAAIYTDGLGELLGTAEVTETGSAAWGSYATLSTPTGGWTWAKIQALETKIYTEADGGIFHTGEVYKVEIEVSSSSVTKSLQYTISEAIAITKSLKYRAARERYSREALTTLPASNDDDLATMYTESDYTDVATDDATRVSVESDGVKYAIHEFKMKNVNNTDSFTINWNGQSEKAGGDGTIYLQVYNRTTTSWETIDSDSTVAANTDVTLSGSKTTSLTDYYDANFVVSCRVYQL